MLKYLFKVFDKDENLIIQVTVPADEMWSTLEKLNHFGIVKGYLLDEDPNVQV